MKKIYFYLLMGMSVALSAQESPEVVGDSITEIDHFTMYPNPAFEDVVYINTKFVGTKEITVYNIFGKVVLRDKIQDAALNITNLIPGVYVMQVVHGKNTMTRKLVVK